MCEQHIISSFLQKGVDLFSDLPIMRPHWDGKRQRIARQEQIRELNKTSVLNLPKESLKQSVDSKNKGCIIRIPW